jgi:hypothetical protein
VDFAVGLYRITARQGRTVVRWRFRIASPRHYGLRVPYFVLNRRGRPVPVVAVGMRPHATLIVDVYRPAVRGHRYATSFTMRTDHRGLASRLLDTAGAARSYILKLRGRGLRRHHDEAATLAFRRDVPGR